MVQAAQRFRGVHDFRNFCKIDATSVKTWVREVRHFTVVLVQKGEDMGEDIWAFEIRGSAFLRSQVRMMVKVLFLIGKGLEKPEVITELLDVEKYKQRPAYTLAPAEPLVLYSCQFPSLQFLLSGSATGDAEGWTNPLDEPSSTPHQEGDIGVMSIAVKNLAADELLSGVEEEWEKRALDFALFKTISRSFVRVAGVDRKALPALPHQPLLEMPLCAGVEQAEENARKKRKRQADRESALLVANK
mmetsp:Transcript_24484/g.61991  ORF Transcript_24484/g.61991 Transcript_24484/m.61991 type:complete len:245 (-) Transcript_24484:1491-2225(-)